MIIRNVFCKSLTAAFTAHYRCVGKRIIFDLLYAVGYIHLTDRKIIEIAVYYLKTVVKYYLLQLRALIEGTELNLSDTVGEYYLFHFTFIECE